MRLFLAKIGLTLHHSVNLRQKSPHSDALKCCEWVAGDNPFLRRCYCDPKMFLQKVIIISHILQQAHACDDKLSKSRMREWVVWRSFAGSLGRGVKQNLYAQWGSFHFCQLTGERIYWEMGEGRGVLEENFRRKGGRRGGGWMYYCQLRGREGFFKYCHHA